jgi:uncharacterized protein
VLDGVCDLFPRLRIGFLEAGAGWIPYMMDRMDEKFHIDRKRKHFPLSKLPSDYFKNGNIYITCETDEKILDAVVREMGEDYLMYPTDFPHEREGENSPKIFRSSGKGTICQKTRREKSSAKTLSGFTTWRNRRL